MAVNKLLATSAIVVLALIVYIEAKGHAPESSDWESFKEFHGKMYVSDAHEAKHKKNFEKHAKAVAAHNLAFKAGKVSYARELNAFADQDPEEFSKIRNGYKPHLTNKTARATSEGLFEASLLQKRLAASSSIDWRTSRKVSPVKDQGSCGSCWSFSATGALESQYLIKQNKTLLFSEQQLVDCDNNDSGCDGGIYEYAWNYIKSNGIESETSYPYTSGRSGSTGSSCLFSKSKVVGTDTGYQSVNLDEASVKQALASKGPLSIALDGRPLQTYSEGVLTCGSSPQINHAVLLVGYGTDSASAKPYWIVKNSWGTEWGEDGYVRISRATNENCGIIGQRYSNIAYPTI